MLKLDDLMAGNNQMNSNNHKGFAHFLKSRSMASLPSCSTEKFKFGNMCVTPPFFSVHNQHVIVHFSTESSLLQTVMVY